MPAGGVDASQPSRCTGSRRARTVPGVTTVAILAALGDGSAMTAGQS